jgi:prepilin-type N-terminal cleavage/methylation domain-containing protein
MRARSSAGFTFIEAIIVIAIVGIVAALGLPALLEVMWRSKVQLAARETTLQLQEARFRTIRDGREVGVFADFAANRIVTFRHLDLSDPADPTDPTDTEQLRFFELPVGIVFQGPADSVPNGADAIVGFAEDSSPGVGGWVTFRPDGAAVMADDDITEGGFRFAMPQRGLYFQAGVGPAATGRIRVLPYDGTEFTDQ